MTNTDDAALGAAKAALRTAALARRAAAFAAAGGAGAALRDTFAGRFGALPAGIAVSGFWPIRDEIDVRPLLEWCAGRGHPVALPAVQGRGRPLAFRRWIPGGPLVDRPFGLREPPDDAAAVRPDLLLVPLLAFDAAGNRLGYGAGYYDMTLASLRRERPVAAVGVAFDAQEADAVPHGALDSPLDWVLTPTRVLRVRDGTDATSILR
ncbi:MAG: 5-formyltetrahydrofolate cyclo-ligase [Rhodospirillales bacterium]